MDMFKRLALLGILASCMLWGTFAHAAYDIAGTTADGPDSFTFEVLDTGGGTGMVGLVKLGGPGGEKIRTVDSSLTLVAAFSGNVGAAEDPTLVVPMMELAAGIYTMYIDKLNPAGSGAGYAYRFTGDVIAAVPLPAAAWLFGSAVLGLGAASRRRAEQSLTA
ncbi:hypothetical protein E4634_13780 [Mangrovimicrobium sediminis]|uniref:VPLPA-CTERM sorting domain-containing protein n=1 Tax=Mangrovimicrobium sediminis TaxID=2562682 RepID=A0A4Z0LZ90_9GAMM|nr:hypothetical protein [Haliea sp. SAOS-164]TGD72591.1 hypothetical protein E4634_13780 [Haliea sp. SAOS-164]